MGMLPIVNRSKCLAKHILQLPTQRIDKTQTLFKSNSLVINRLEGVTYITSRQMVRSLCYEKYLE